MRAGGKAKLSRDTTSPPPGRATGTVIATRAGAPASENRLEATGRRVVSATRSSSRSPWPVIGRAAAPGPSRSWPVVERSMMRMSRARASSPSARSMTARSPLSRAGEWAASSVTAPCTARSRSTAAATLWRISVPCCSSRWRSAPVDCHRRRPTKPRTGRMKAAQSAARCHSTGQAPRKAGRRDLAASGGAVGPTMGMALSALIDAPQDPDAVSRALVRRPGAEGRANAAKVRTGVPRLARVRTAVAVAAHPLDVCAAPEARTRFGR
jgi:hypothetical protein